MAVCPRCGRESPDASRFCPGCGATLVAAEPHEVRKTVTVLFADVIESTPLGAAAEMRAALAALNVEIERDHGVQLEIRMGVNTGEVVASDQSTGQTLVTGDAVNVAARLEQSAAPGQILIGSETERLVRTAVRATGPEQIDVKGKSKPIVAFALEPVIPDVSVPA